MALLPQYATVAAVTMSSVTHIPSAVKCSAIVCLCATKNSPASSISAGKAHFDSTLSMRSAAFGYFILTTMPTTIGSSIVTRFCVSRLPMGSCMPTGSPIASVVYCIIAGTVARVMTELNAVSDTDSATSPLASIEKMLLEDPPGQQAISITPIYRYGGSPKAVARAAAINGSTTNCPHNPTRAARGRLATRRKSRGCNVRPRSNMSSVSMGRTMKTVSRIFSCVFFHGAKLHICFYLRHVLAVFLSHNPFFIRFFYP